LKAEPDRALRVNFVVSQLLDLETKRDIRCDIVQQPEEKDAFTKLDQKLDKEVHFRQNWTFNCETASPP
jgi:hypothetical protein